MRKVESLKSLLLATVPGLDKNPETLAIFIDRGTIFGGGGTSLSFEYRYAVNLVFEGYAMRDGLDAIMVPILAWLAENQPEQLNTPAAQPFTFDAELLDADTVDVSITVNLTEAVVVVPGEGGGYGVTHPAPPPRHDIDRFAGVPCAAELWKGFANGLLVAHSAKPEAQP